MKFGIKFFFSSLLIISSFSCNKSENNSNSFKSYSGPAQCNMSKNANISEMIIGGDPANGSTVPTGNNTVAILLYINSSKTVLCSGTIVASNLILTAGHCFDNVEENNISPGKVVFSNSYSPATSSNSSEISCWQRPPNYRPCSADNSYNCVLNDITWVKINGTIKSGYNPVSILSNPQTLSTTEKKWMLGFGDNSDNGSNSGYKNMVISESDKYSDTIPDGAIDSFNRQTFSNAFQNFLTVIGPNSGKGTCEGDSGGPVYVQRGPTDNYVLAALTQGSNSLLSPHPKTTSPPYSFDTSKYASCSDGYGVYTTVGNYVNWIQSTSGISLSLY